jgi:alpha-beta hydrolase superfamily lysophospholipase
LIVLVAASFLLVGCSSTTSFFFYPQTRWVSTPEDVVQPYTNVILTAQDGTRLHSWWLPAQGEDKKIVVLYLHGNAQNISTHSHSIYWLVKQGINVLALDYRGFGASQGEASLPDIFQDIESATIWIRQQHPNKRLVILGQSIGAALAIDFTAKAAERYQIEALVLDAPFESFAGVARDVTRQNMISMLLYPFTVLVPDTWDPIDRIAEISLPTLMMHSPDDGVVPYRHGLQLFHKLQTNPKAQGCWITGRGAHIASFAYEDIRLATLQFIEENKCH